MGRSRPVPTFLSVGKLQSPKPTAVSHMRIAATRIERGTLIARQSYLREIEFQLHVEPHLDAPASETLSKMRRSVPFLQHSVALASRARRTSRGTLTDGDTRSRRAGGLVGGNLEGTNHEIDSFSFGCFCTRRLPGRSGRR